MSRLQYLFVLAFRLRRRIRFAYGCRMIRSVEDGLVADGLVAYGCGMIKNVHDGLVADSLIASGCGMTRSVNREFKITTTATATGTSLNERFNEQNNGCERAL